MQPDVRQPTAREFAPALLRTRERTRSQAFIDSRLLALEAAVLLAVARLLVRYVRIGRWRSLLTTAPSESLQPPRWRGLPSVRRVTRVVPRVADRVPFEAVCLPQAMAAQWMLHRRGVRCRLLFGALRTGAAGAEDAELAGPERRGGLLPRGIRRFFIGDLEGEAGAASGLRLHAWLTIDGECVLGGDVSGYKALPPFDATPMRRRRSK